ncbi:MAG: FkbM family methyltransferase [Candidatus Methanomethylicaceae archaeon]
MQKLTIFYAKTREEITKLRDEFHVFTNDKGISRELILFRVHEPNFTNLLSNIVKDNDVIIDVGANIGYYTVLFCKRAYNGKIIAIEPNPLSFKLLQHNTKNFQNVKNYRMALSDKTGLVSFEVLKNITNLSRLSINEKSRSSLTINKYVIQVPSTTLDNLILMLYLDKVDLIRMDVEGAELQILFKGMKTLKRFKPTIALEVHPKELGLDKTILLIDTLASMYNYAIICLRIFDYYPNLEGLYTLIQSKELSKLIRRLYKGILGDTFSVIFLREKIVQDFMTKYKYSLHINKYFIKKLLRCSSSIVN